MAVKLDFPPRQGADVISLQSQRSRINSEDSFLILTAGFRAKQEEKKSYMVLVILFKTIFNLQTYIDICMRDNHLFHLGTDVRAALAAFNIN